MLTHIIDKGDTLFEEQFGLYDADSLNDYTDIKSFIHSQQLALLEGMKKDIKDGHDECGYECSCYRIIQSLEESITYLKSL